MKMEVSTQEAEHLRCLRKNRPADRMRIIMMTEFFAKHLGPAQAVSVEERKAICAV